MTDALFLILIIVGGVYALLMLALPFIVFGINITCLHIFTKDNPVFKIDPCDNERFKLACHKWAQKVEPNFK